VNYLVMFYFATPTIPRSLDSPDKFGFRA